MLETIIVSFLPEEENITWEKRKISEIHIGEPSNIETVSKETNSPDNQLEKQNLIKKEEIASSQNINSNKEEEKICVEASGKNDKTNKFFVTERPKKQDEKTARGIEIQKQLESLKYEVKRKDLNPIEKENLQKDLLKLQKEIIEERDKFSKADDIQTRLQSIEINLNKLKKSEDEFLEKKIEKKEEPVVVKEDNTVTAQDKPKKKGRNTIKLFSLSQ